MFGLFGNKKESVVKSALVTDEEFRAKYEKVIKEKQAQLGDNYLLKHKITRKTKHVSKPQVYDNFIANTY